MPSLMSRPRAASIRLIGAGRPVLDAQPPSIVPHAADGGILQRWTTARRGLRSSRRASSRERSTARPCRRSPARPPAASRGGAGPTRRRPCTGPIRGSRSARTEGGSGGWRSSGGTLVHRVGLDGDGRPLVVERQFNAEREFVEVWHHDEHGSWMVHDLLGDTLAHVYRGPWGRAHVTDYAERAMAAVRPDRQRALSRPHARAELGRPDGAVRALAEGSRRARSCASSSRRCAMPRRCGPAARSTPRCAPTRTTPTTRAAGRRSMRSACACSRRSTRGRRSRTRPTRSSRSWISTRASTTTGCVAPSPCSAASASRRSSTRSPRRSANGGADAVDLDAARRDPAVIEAWARERGLGEQAAAIAAAARPAFRLRAGGRRRPGAEQGRRQRPAGAGHRVAAIVVAAIRCSFLAGIDLASSRRRRDRSLPDAAGALRRADRSPSGPTPGGPLARVFGPRERPAPSRPVAARRAPARAARLATAQLTLEDGYDSASDSAELNHLRRDRARAAVRPAAHEAGVGGAVGGPVVVGRFARRRRPRRRLRRRPRCRRPRRRRRSRDESRRRRPHDGRVPRRRELHLGTRRVARHGGPGRRRRPARRSGRGQRLDARRAARPATPTSPSPAPCCSCS